MTHPCRTSRAPGVPRPGVPAGLAVLTLLALSSLTVPAAAQTRTVERTEWYGYQTLSTDAAAVSFVLVPAFSEQEGLIIPFVLAGVATYMAGAPVVHAANGEEEKGLVSLGCRVGTLIIPAFMVMNAKHDLVSKLGAGIGAVFFGVVGAITVSVADAVLARKTVTETAPTLESGAGPLTLPPTLSWGGTF